MKEEALQGRAEVRVEPAAVVLVAGDPVPAAERARGGFFTLIREAVGAAWPGPWRSVDLRRELAPDLTDAACIIVSGSAARLGDAAPWMTAALATCRRLVAAERPLFGICFGHQLLGEALGGRVGPNPRGRELGTVPLTLLAPDEVIGDFRDDSRGGPLEVNTTHLDSVLELPPGAALLAATELEPHAAVRFGREAWGVQFHPEIDAEVMRHYVAARAEALALEGRDVEALGREARDARAAAAMLQAFLRRVSAARSG